MTGRFLVIVLIFIFGVSVLSKNAYRKQNTDCTWPYRCFLQPRTKDTIAGFHAVSGDTNNNGEMNKLLVDKQNELMSDLLFAVHQHGGDDVT